MLELANGNGISISFGTMQDWVKHADKVLKYLAKDKTRTYALAVKRTGMAEPLAKEVLKGLMDKKYILPDDPHSITDAGIAFIKQGGFNKQRQNKVLKFLNGVDFTLGVINDTLDNKSVSD